MGVFGAGMVGTAISALSTASLVKSGSFQGPFLVAAAALAAYAIIAALALRDAPGRQRSTRSMFARLAAIIRVTANSSSTAWTRAACCCGTATRPRRCPAAPLPHPGATPQRASADPAPHCRRRRSQRCEGRRSSGLPLIARATTPGNPSSAALLALPQTRSGHRARLRNDNRKSRGTARFASSCPWSDRVLCRRDE
jgi:hypothetical protein